MRYKDKRVLLEIKHFVNDYCDANGRGPAVSEVASQFGMSKSTAQAYLTELKETGEIMQSEYGYESKLLSEQR